MADVQIVTVTMRAALSGTAGQAVDDVRGVLPTDPIELGPRWNAIPFEVDRSTISVETLTREAYDERIGRP